jgi:hypothetical protein
VLLVNVECDCSVCLVGEYVIAYGECDGSVIGLIACDFKKRG